MQRHLHVVEIFARDRMQDEDVSVLETMLVRPTLIMSWEVVEGPALVFTTPESGRHGRSK